MKPIALFLICMCLLCGPATELQAQGYIVPNGIVVNFGGLFFPDEINVLHDPNNPSSGGSYTGFTLRPVGNDNFAFDPVVDVGVRVFFVSSGDPVSLQAIGSLSYPELMVPNSYTFANRSIFYVGLYTGSVETFTEPQSYINPVFGWAKLRNNNGTIQLLDSALVYQADGIFAGTQNIIQSVPEPSVAGLSVLGGLLLAWRCRRASGS